MKNVLLVVMALAIVALSYLLVDKYFLQTDTTDSTGVNISVEDILSFEDCEAAGLPVMESHPRQCRTPDGRLFAEEIAVQPTYENASADMIEVFTPHAGGVVGKEFLVVGKARGQWYFEGSFPVEVIGADGNQIAGGIATAVGDWMTTDFVEFKTDLLDLPSAYRGPATLILRRDNASGLPEHDAAIIIPIVVEY